MSRNLVSTETVEQRRGLLDRGLADGGLRENSMSRWRYFVVYLDQPLCIGNLPSGHRLVPLRDDCRIVGRLVNQVELGANVQNSPVQSINQKRR